MPECLFAARPDQPILWTIASSEDGKHFATGASDGNLTIYLSKNNTVVKSYKFAHAVQSVAWNSKYPLLAVGLDAEPAKIINTETFSIITTETKYGSRAVDWKPDGTLLAIGDYEGILVLCNQNGVKVKEIKKSDTKSFITVHWHPFKNEILTGSDKIISFDTSGNIILDIKHRPENTILLTVRWHPEGSLFAAGDYGQKENNIISLLQFWDANGRLINSFSESKAEFRNVRWNKAGTILASSSDCLRTWSVEKGLTETRRSSCLLWGLSWLNNDKSIATGDEKGKLRRWTYGR